MCSCGELYVNMTFNIVTDTDTEHGTDTDTDDIDKLKFFEFVGSSWWCWNDCNRIAGRGNI